MLTFTSKTDLGLEVQCVRATSAKTIKNNDKSFGTGSIRSFILFRNISYFSLCVISGVLYNKRSDRDNSTTCSIQKWRIYDAFEISESNCIFNAFRTLNILATIIQVGRLQAQYESSRCVSRASM